jgi:NitT/TauT family transport system substrate-binding protein
MGFEILSYGVKALRPLCLPEGFDESRLGEMSAERWQTLFTQMSEIGLIKHENMKAEDDYSLKFLSSN